MMKTSEHLQWEAFISSLDPLIKEGYHITISRINVPSDVYEDVWRYWVGVTDRNGTIVATGKNYPLSAAMANAYIATPEKQSK